ncbi:MAG: hypothetical protein BWY89_02035 [Bacteroidetes bacterium ADurb.BinA012]|nr:MAG: hypothetical protein BWY89_02035 [Bacteroidetes bacterium ADurb.BinA012]
MFNVDIRILPIEIPDCEFLYLVAIPCSLRNLYHKVAEHRVFLPDVNGKFNHYSASQVQGTRFEGV